MSTWTHKETNQTLWNGAWPPHTSSSISPHLRAIRQSGNDLGRHPVGRAHQRLPLGHFFGNLGAEAEVGELDLQTDGAFMFQSITSYQLVKRHLISGTPPGADKDLVATLLPGRRWSAEWSRSWCRGGWRPACAGRTAPSAPTGTRWRSAPRSSWHRRITWNSVVVYLVETEKLLK